MILYILCIGFLEYINVKIQIKMIQIRLLCICLYVARRSDEFQLLYSRSYISERILCHLSASSSSPYDRDLLILASLIRNQDTNKGYAEVSSGDNMLVKGMSKSTFFQSVNYLLNLELITLIKKKIGRYYTMESQILLSDESIVSVELRKRL